MKEIKKIVKNCIYFLLCAVILAGCSGNSGTQPGESESAAMYSNQALNNLASSSASVVALSMTDASFFTTERFTTYMGLDAYVWETTATTGSEVLSVLYTAMESGKSRVYLQLDPAVIKQTGPFSFTEEFCVIANATPECSYQILLPNPPLSYWTSLAEEEMADTLNCYRDFLLDLSPCSNITCYYLGAEEWLYRNPAHFRENTLATNEEISQKLFLFTFCDGLYTTNATTFEEQAAGLREAAQTERTSPIEYPDYSGKTFVFFGDSIIDYVHGSHSIPGFLAGLTGAKYESYAHSGASATQRTDYPYSFPEVVDEFLATRTAADYNDTELVFFLHFGLNDYFTGLPVDNQAEDTLSYASSLRTCIAELREAFPEAYVILSGPTFTSLYEAGTMINSEEGSILTEYRDAAKAVAVETGSLFLDNYKTWELGPDTAATLLTDGVHPGEEGRYLFTLHFLDFLNHSF